MSSMSTETSSPSEPRYNMDHESNRLNTFVDWPHSFLDPRILAKSGLYFARAPDTVTCNFCKISMNEFKKDEDVIERHFSQGVQTGLCVLLLGYASGENVALPPDSISNELEQVVSKLKPIYMDKYIEFRFPNDKYVTKENDSC